MKENIRKLNYPFKYFARAVSYFNLLKTMEMAKVKPGIIQMVGKVGDDIIIDSHRYGRFTRKVVKQGSKKDEPVLKAQYKRTGRLNRLASELNTIIRDHSNGFKTPRFYEELHKRFRKEPLNKRCLLLQQLTGMEVNPSYPLQTSGDRTVAVTAVKNKIVVNLKITSKPAPGKFMADCFCYEVLLIRWNKTNVPAKFERQISEWSYLKDGLPEFEFFFSKPPGTKEWLVCIRQQLGIKEQPLIFFPAIGMQITEVGSFDKKEQALMDNRKTVNAKTSFQVKVRKENEILRVKAKRIL
jgi:hypothetical protein